ncbi:ADP-forming succinate--CoA ligase subunit beta [Rubricoccus marinus]|uniref:Succinate--CoA ligase [ADP-forming] subunit beta n=1 Tax=Rubricoccus marinus TaxID=716817 RepID=A0A259TYN8_9BACT|nr:ADP-forming succinate--CoA ligase subunit beta [Rubricoccus marinus]OZC02810.1 succinate--CoA ligase subunit beta [Rubricoccus marinus]
MKVHEYQAKEILDQYGVAVQRGIVADTVEEAVEAAQTMAADGVTQFVVKAQIHAGGRGKGGGVKFCPSIDDVKPAAEKILGMQLITPQTGAEGQLVRKVLVTAAEDIAHEYYLGVTLDRATGMDVIMASTEGGVEIEEVAEATPEKIVKVHVDPTTGLRSYQAREIAFQLGLEGTAFKEGVKFVMALYKAYRASDATIAEINPLVKTEDGRIIALDAKMDLDDNAMFRHKDLAEMRDEAEEDPLEVEAGKHNLNYIKLDGNVGCMVNGAGLAMGTMDLIKLAGGEPANFLDVGGTASPATTEAGFRIIQSDPNVKAILVNIFGGIVRCDRVAKGVVEAASNMELTVPLIVRLQGTNAEEGMQILKDSGLPIQTAIRLQEAADKVTAALDA